MAEGAGNDNGWRSVRKGLWQQSGKVKGSRDFCHHHGKKLREEVKENKRLGENEKKKEKENTSKPLNIQSVSVSSYEGSKFTSEQFTALNSKDPCPSTNDHLLTAKESQKQMNLSHFLRMSSLYRFSS